MRIRKRDVPLPLSSLSPIHLSDPIFLVPDHLPSVVQLPLLPASKSPAPQAFNNPDRPPKEELTADYSLELGDAKARGGRGGVAPSETTNSNYDRSRGDPDDAEKSTSGWSRSAVSASVPIEASTDTTPKKRRVSSGGDVNGGGNKTETEAKASSMGNNGGRRRRRGGGSIGGGGASTKVSGCSRVNGRGWRCSRQTLAGYSLCEHHLDKGRIRNVRGRSMIGATERFGNGSDPEPTLPSSGSKEGNDIMLNIIKAADDYGDEDDEDSVAANEKKKKARSMSSLLGQGPNGCIAATPSPIVEGI